MGNLRARASELVAQEIVLPLQPALGAAAPVPVHVEQLQLSVDALQQNMNELQLRMDKLLRHMNRVPLRALKDRVRTKLNGDQDLSPEQQQAWNERIECMTDAELAAAGLTRSQVQLTRYGRRPVPPQARSAARGVSVEEMAEAVISCDTDHQKLFEFVYGATPEEVVADEWS